MSFDRPLLLLTLLVLPAAVGIYLLAERRRMRYAVTFTNLDVLASVAGGRAWRRVVPPVVFLVALASLCVALARPHARTLVPSDRATVILVIDASRSMASTDIRPTRLAAAEAAARTFLDKAPKRLKIGLIVFAGEPQVATPPTTQHELVRESIDQIGNFSGYGGTAIGDALALAVQLAQQSVTENGRTLASVGAAGTPATRGVTSILFLSDGAQTRGTLAPGEGAQRAKDAGIPVYTVALGTPNGTVTGGFGGYGYGQQIPVPPDPQTLSAIARTTGGEFTSATTAATLQSVYSKLGSSLGRTPGRTEITYAFLLAAAALLVAAGGLSALWAPRLP